MKRREKNDAISKKKAMIDVDRGKDKKMSDYPKQTDKKNSYTTYSKGESESFTVFKENKAKIESIFMDIEYIRCPVTKLIVVNNNLFKGG